MNRRGIKSIFLGYPYTYKITDPNGKGVLRTADEGQDLLMWMVGGVGPSVQARPGCGDPRRGQS